MVKSKKVVYNVQCPHNTEHLFQRELLIEDGTENVVSTVEAYCPWCEVMLNVEVQGRLVPNKKIIMKFGISEEEIEQK